MHFDYSFSIGLKPPSSFLVVDSPPFPTIRNDGQRRHIWVLGELSPKGRDEGMKWKVLWVTLAGSSNIAGWKMGAPDGVDVFPIENGHVPLLC